MATKSRQDVFHCIYEGQRDTNAWVLDVPNTYIYWSLSWGNTESSWRPSLCLPQKRGKGGTNSKAHSSRCFAGQLAHMVFCCASPTDRAMTSHDMAHQVNVTQRCLPNTTAVLRGKWERRAAGFSLAGPALPRPEKETHELT